MTDPEPEPRPAAGAHPHPTPAHPDARPRRAAKPAEEKPTAPPIPAVVAGSSEDTRSFSKADIDALRVALAGDRRRAEARRNPVPSPPNLGAGLAIVLVVTVIMLVGLAALISWLLLGPVYPYLY